MTRQTGECNCKNIMKALGMLQDSIVFYQILEEKTNNPYALDLMEGIRENEMKNYQSLCRLFVRLSGKKPELPAINDPVADDFVSGLNTAVMNEFTAADMLKKMYFDASDSCAKRILFEACSDKCSNSAKLNFIYTQTVEVMTEKIR